MTKAPEDTVIELAENLGKFIAANIVPERQNKIEAAAINRIYQAADAERVRLAAVCEDTQ